MSFADYSRGTGGSSTPPPIRSSSIPGPTPQSHEITIGQSPLDIPLTTTTASSSPPSLSDWDHISSKVFSISSDISTLQKLASLIGTIKDTPSLRQQIHALTEQTRDAIRKTSSELKTLSAATARNTSLEDSHLSSESQRIKILQKKLTSDFEECLKRFQNVSRLAAEKSREYVTRATQAVKAAHEEDQEANETQPLLGSQQRQQQHQMQVLDTEVEFNEALIAEREADLVNIEQSILEVNEIFRDLGTIVNEQQYLLDNIETNVSHIAINAENATSELRAGERLQASAQRWKCYIFLFLLIITSLVVLVVFRPWSWRR